MFLQADAISALIANIINKIMTFSEVKKVAHEINNDTRNIDFFVSLSMPTYNRELVRKLIELEIVAENAADSLQYILNFEYILREK